MEIEGNSTTTTTSGDVVEAGAAPIDPTRCRACLLQNNFEPFDKVDEKRHGLFSEQLETSNDSDKDHILEVSKSYICIYCLHTLVTVLITYSNSSRNQFRVV